MASKLIAILILVVLISSSMSSYSPSFAQSALSPQTPLKMKITDLITKDDLANKEWAVVKGGKIPIGEMYVPLVGNAYYNNWTFYNGKQILTSAKDICNFVDNNKHVLGTKSGVAFILGQDNDTNFNGKMWVSLSYDDTPNPRKEFICITASSQADPTGIQLVMEEGQPNKHHFANIGVLRYGDNIVSSDHDYGPLLHTNPTDVIHFSLNYNGKIYTTDRTVKIPNGIVIGGEGSNGGTFPPSLITSPDVVNCGSSGDVDNDGICDAWESGGPLSVTLNGANYIGPACGGIGQDVCPTPTKKDVFVMADEMNGYTLNQGVVSDLQTVFKGSPSSPPLINGRSTTIYPVVQLHIQEFQNGLDPNSAALINGINFPGSTNANDFNFLKSQDILRPDTGYSGPNPEKAKMAVFHYALLANKIIGDTGSSGLGEQFGNDMVVSLGDPSFGTTPTVTEQEGTLMHELGHNLNLNHGGNTDTNCIPNYLSVMNYLYQFPLLVSTRPLDYSQSVIGDTSGHTYIDDTNLGLATGSSHGVGASTPSGLVVIYATPGVAPFFDTVTAGSEVREWNVQTPFSAMINDFTQTTPPIPGCTGTSGKLWGFKDWDKTTSSVLKFAYSGGKTGQPSANYGLNAADVKAMWQLRLNQVSNAITTYGINTQDYQNSTYYQNSLYYKNSTSNPLTVLNTDLKQNDTNAFIKDLNALNNAIGADTTISLINKTKSQNTINDVSNSFKLTYGYTKISFDNNYVPIDSTATISVQDPDVNAKVNSVKVHLISDNDTAGIDLILDRDKSGMFSGTVTFTSNSSVANSKLHVGIGDSVTAVYNDLFTTTTQVTTGIPPPPPIQQQFQINPQDFGINMILQ